MTTTAKDPYDILHDIAYGACPEAAQFWTERDGRRMNLCHAAVYDLLNTEHQDEPARWLKNRVRSLRRKVR